MVAAKLEITRFGVENINPDNIGRGGVIGALQARPIELQMMPQRARQTGFAHARRIFNQ